MNRHVKAIRQVLYHPYTLASLALFMFAFVLRLGWVLQNHPPLFSDLEDYVQCAAQFARGGYLAQSPERLAYRPPLYPTLITYCIWLFPSGFMTALRVFQAMLSALSCVFVYGCAIQLLKPLQNHTHMGWLYPWISLAAGVLMALSGTAVFFSGVVMTESVYLALLTGWLFLGLWNQTRKSYLVLVLFSVLLGVMALVRPISLLFIPIVIVVALSHIPRNQWKRLIWLPACAWVLPILPWTIRNLVVLGSFVLISTNSGVNFYIGQHPAYSYWSTGGKEIFRQEVQAEFGPNEVIEDRMFFNTGLEMLRMDPLGFFPRAGLKLYYLYWLDKEPWPWSEYALEKETFRLSLEAFPFFWWSPAWLPLALAGGFYAWLIRSRHQMLMGVVLLYTLACVVYFARTRFRIPLEPILILYIILGITSLIDMGIRLYAMARGGKTQKEDDPLS